MSDQARFTLRGRNPDVLTCIANLSNDEVFTPPVIANQMLDTLAEAWAAENNGASIWADRTVRFLDPCTKSGVFLREITRRLTEGLAEEITDLQERIDHILTRQVFGIGTSYITSLLARRSVYCSKHAIGEHSIATSFAVDDGNIWFERTEHSWVRGRCKYCGASRKYFDRGEELETHAYAFIHTSNIKARMAELFGGDMQFDVIVGNPPYQIDDEGGHRPVPLYHKFVRQAKMLAPRQLVMVTPSRWMAGGLGLSAFRSEMLGDPGIRALIDYPISKEVFPRVEVKGGISYFLWSRDNPGTCSFTTVRDGVSTGPSPRHLDKYDILVRDSLGVSLLDRVLDASEPGFDNIVASVRPFGDQLRSNFRDYQLEPSGDYQVPLLVNESGRRVEVWTRANYLTSNHELAAGWKVFLPKAGSDGGQRLPNRVIGSPRIGRPHQISTETYLAIGPFESESQARAAYSYLTTKVARYLISLRKVSQDNVPSTFKWLPIPDWTKPVTDEALKLKYGVSEEESAHIDAMVSTWKGSDERPRH